MSTEFFSNSQHHLWQRCRMKDSFFWEDLVEREISLRTLGDLSSLPGRPREISLSLAGSTTAWAVCIFRPIFSPNRELNRSHRVLYFHERSNTDYDYGLLDEDGISHMWEKCGIRWTGMKSSGRIWVESTQVHSTE